MRVHGQTRAFVYQKKVFVLINDIQLWSSNGQIGVILPGLIEKFVIDIQRQHISGLQAGVPFGPGTVQLDTLDADIFLGEGRRQQRDGLCEKAIQPLSGIVLSNGQFFHKVSFVCSKWRLI